MQKGSRLLEPAHSSVAANSPEKRIARSTDRRTRLDKQAGAGSSAGESAAG